MEMRPHDWYFDSLETQGSRLPREGVVYLRAVAGNRLQPVFKGKKIGDPISSMSDRIDFHQYHDLFHVAISTILGWSPVLRKLLTVERPHKPYEDSPRARIAEEAIAHVVSSSGEKMKAVITHKPHTPIILDESELCRLIITIQTLCNQFEVSERENHEWVNLIYSYYLLLSQLRDYKELKIYFNTMQGNIFVMPYHSV